MLRRKFQPSFPYQYNSMMAGILQIKYPKYFTGKFRPQFYCYFPDKQKQYERVSKAVKNFKGLNYLPNPNISKSYQMYHFRNHKGLKSIYWAEFSEYDEMIQNLSNHAKKALKNYLFSQIKLEYLSLEVNEFSQYLTDLILLWIKKLQNLKELSIDNYYPGYMEIDREMPTQFIGKIIQSASQTLKTLKLYGCSPYPAEVVESINCCKGLECLSITLDFQNEDEELKEKLLKLNCTKLKQVKLDLYYCSSKVWTYLLSQLKECQDLDIALAYSENLVGQEVNEVLQTIPKRLKCLSISFSGFEKLIKERLHSILSKIIVEEKFGILGWKPFYDESHLKVFKNKLNIQDLHIELGNNNLSYISSNLQQFKNLRSFTFKPQDNSLKGDWPLSFSNFFKSVSLKTIDIAFSMNCTNNQALIGLLKILLAKGEIKEIYLRQRQLQRELIQLIKFFLDVKKKNFYLFLSQDIDYSKIPLKGYNGIQSEEEVKRVQFMKQKYSLDSRLETIYCITCINYMHTILIIFNQYILSNTRQAYNISHEYFKHIYNRL